jgi:hypothetical protein
MSTSIHRSCLAGGPLSLLLIGAGAACSAACAQPPKAPQATVASPTVPSKATPGAWRSSAAAINPQSSSPRGGMAASPPRPSNHEETDEEEDVELVVSREVVGRCPTLRLVREHVGEFDPDMVWLAVLESIADCMSQGSPMAEQSIGVSGDEEHRHVVREVLGSRGVAPTRVVARLVGQGTEGAAECQGGTNCNKRVEITILGPKAAR